MIPKMDPEVAKAAIAQFPEFKGFALDVVHICKDVLEQTHESNNRCQENFYAICDSIIISLQSELENQNPSSEDRERIENQMIEVARMVMENDKANKKFLLKLAAIFTLGMATIVATAGSVLGSNSQISTDDTDDADEDNAEKSDDEADIDDEVA